MQVETDTVNDITFAKVNNVVHIHAYGVSAQTLRATTIPSKYRTSLTPQQHIIYARYNNGAYFAILSVGSNASMNATYASSYGADNYNLPDNGVVYIDVCYTIV